MSDKPVSGLDAASPPIAQVHAGRLAPQWAARLRALTPARVGLGRTGVSQETGDLLDFQRSHALARDAVHGRLEAGALAATLTAITSRNAMRLHSAAGDRATYLQRPDLGRVLDDASRATLAQRQAQPTEESGAPKLRLAIVVADGLSALAVERHAASLIEALLPLLANWQLAPICIVGQARVAIGDEIGVALGADVSIVLIGELRPGRSPDSLGAYITWSPRPGRTDAERNCISNIRGEGLSYAQAAAQLSYYLTEASRRRLTGVALKEEAPAQPSLPA
jgi:ethanolamine ammonia-lyase small subunit